VSLQTIVIGTSLSAVSDGIVRTGVAVARTSGAAVWLVHVCAPATLPPEIPHGGENAGAGDPGVAGQASSTRASPIAAGIA
jgi:hypothetical protein